MAKLNLSNHTDREIVSAIFGLPAQKFLSVINAVAAVSQQMEKRGKTIAQQDSDDVIEDMMRRLFEGE